jgi:hypothetical protein
VENAPTLAQPGSALFRYVAKMAAVEYEKCTSPHASRFDRFEYTIRVVNSTLICARSESEKLKLVSTDMDI